ncbi:DUF432 domain-containing protein [Candidatus Nitrosotenuis sp. DW1]|uniref:DUF432 domain-containing protein n=1 Tax=Candidatus Nitrosotenuis sp. DW1 TaxID=2259672 RepID=UPI0015C7CD95|nr:DUF432 domain-containing protein [Candidatus Nitrosotenuis sp. DW1]QLH08787.1 hypothetical protein DSQ19_04185 [Candidatus Nitrosotenuis sp. DW1]
MVIDTVRESNEISKSSDFKFGKYTIKKDTTLHMPENEIQFSKIDSDKFSYARKDSEKVTRKTIHCKTKDLEIEMAPILPIHLPSYKTDFVFLRFADPIFISGKSTTEITVPFPIEIGVFLINDDHADMLDCFSCEPSYSRFGLYGTPEEGRLCKYAKIPPSFDKKTSSSLAHANLRIAIENDLEESAQVGKIIIPASDHDLYYNDENVIMDDLNVMIKNRGGLKIIEVVQKQITKPDDWSLSPRNIKKTDYRFAMEWGFD